MQRRTDGGFSLIEINLAILVIATGMLILFSLFPAGLKQVETAQAGTQEAMFAGYVMTTLRGAAGQMTNAVTWTNFPSCQTTLFNTPSVRAAGLIADRLETREFPAGSGQHLRYWLQVGDEGDHLRSISLWCKAGRYGAGNVNTFKTVASKFYTEMFFMGMP